MVIYDPRAFKIAQEVSREAVAGGSVNGYQFDWSAAMTVLKVAYGYAPIEIAEEYYEYKG